MSRKHMPWDEPWEGAGVPRRHGFWTDERIQQADVLVSDFLSSDFDRVVRNGLSAETYVKKRPGAENIPIVAISNEHNEVEPIQYDNRHLTEMATDAAIRRARGGGGD